MDHDAFEKKMLEFYVCGADRRGVRANHELHLVRATIYIIICLSRNPVYFTPTTTPVAL
jgi:hypothetical protein